MHRIAETGEALYRGFEGADQRLKPAAQRCRNHAKGAAQLLQATHFQKTAVPGCRRCATLLRRPGAAAATASSRPPAHQLDRDPPLRRRSNQPVGDLSHGLLTHVAATRH